MKALRLKQVQAMLAAGGFTHNRINTGNHIVYRHNSGISISLPNHREVSAGVLRVVLKAIANAQHN